MDVIYADELVAVNALADYLLMCLAARAAEVPMRRGRFALAGLLGGGYALAAAAGGPALRSLWLALPFSAVLCAAAFGAGRGFLRGWAAFLAMSALLSGAILALGRLTGAPGAAGHVSLRLLGGCFVLCRAGLGLWRARFRPGERIVPVELALGRRQVTLSALRDTGNRLFDPITGSAVLVADAEALAPLLGGAPPPEAAEDSAALFRQLARDPLLAPRLGLVPYRAVGGGGVMVTLRPDRVTADGGPVRALAAVSPTPVRGDGYNAIL